MTRPDTAGLRALLAAGIVEAVALDGVDWTDFEGAEARFVDCVFEGVQFSGTDFSGARFLRCLFVRCRFATVPTNSAGLSSRTPSARADLNTMRRHFTE